VRNALTVCDIASAVLAILAAIAWGVAASHPVGVPGPGLYWPEDQTHRARIAAQGAKILRGARYNQVAAALTGLSALLMGISTLLRRMIPGG
jgi:hypothetical protein